MTKTFTMQPADNWSAAVTDVPCPACGAGTLRWHEAGTVPGYRRCDGCGAEFTSNGSAREPVLTLVE